MADQSAMEEATPLMGGSPSKQRRSRWQAAACATATLGVVALARGSRTAPTAANAGAQPVLYDRHVPTTANTQPPKDLMVQVRALEDRLSRAQA